jgi:hypothetical protein
MPTAATHKKASLHYLGQYTPWLQAAIDAASQGELKSAHRYLYHDVGFLQAVKKAFGEEIGREALLHMVLDLERYRPNKLFPLP